MNGEEEFWTKKPMYNFEPPRIEVAIYTAVDELGRDFGALQKRVYTLEKAVADLTIRLGEVDRALGKGGGGSHE